MPLHQHFVTKKTRGQDMQKTERLYFNDSGLLDFSGTVVEIRPTDRGSDVVLDQTAFYPTGGGQPNDLGTLGSADVVDVFEKDDVIYHSIVNRFPYSVGEAVRGKVERARRNDHIQQHSGQHVLSQAFIQACGAETRSFHLGEKTSTIDIDLQAPTDELTRAAEDIANDIVLEDRPMTVHMVDEEGAKRFPLRKESQVGGNIRIIEVQDFDWSPCGGTHAHRTGQIGMIAIRSFERAKKMTRVEFVCGGRALQEYRQARDVAFAVARLFSADRDKSPELVERALAENKASKRRIHGLLELAMTAEAAERLSKAEEFEGFKVVRDIFDARDLEEVRMLAAKIVQQEASVALLGIREKESARLVFARSSSLTMNMGELLGEACAILGGRGGGRPDMAQGGGPNVTNLEEALSFSLKKLKTQ